MNKEQKEKDYFLAGIKNLIELSQRQDTMRFSGFLNETERALAEPLVKKSKVLYKFYGGFPDAQRVVLGVFPEGYEALDEYFPISGFTVTFPENYKLSHSDFLGTLMAQQIKRETLGDIVICDGKANIYALEKIEKVISTQIDKIGGVGVTITKGIDNPIEVLQKFKSIKGTLASLRLDAAVALVTGLSREKAAMLISSKCVFLNYLEKTQATAKLNEGDILTVRGYGKYKLTKIGNETRKGRTGVIFEAYIN